MTRTALVDQENHAKNVRLATKQKLPQIAFQLPPLGSRAAALRMRSQRDESVLKPFHPKCGRLRRMPGNPQIRCVEILLGERQNLNPERHR